MDCHDVREEILKGVIKPFHVSSTKDQLADIHTNALGRKKFDSFVFKLDITKLYAPS